MFLRPNLCDRAAEEKASTFSHGVSGCTRLEGQTMQRRSAPMVSMSRMVSRRTSSGDSRERVRCAPMVAHGTMRCPHLPLTAAASMHSGWMGCSTWNPRSTMSGTMSVMLPQLCRKNVAFGNRARTAERTVFHAGLITARQRVG